MREAWHVLEPETTFVHNWHLDVICDHLEAVTRGDITRLLINVPPGSMKSMLVSVLWPAWEWGPKGKAHLRYISSSFSNEAATRDTRKMRDLILSEWFQTRWPLKLTRTGETSIANASTGFRECSPFESLTSKRGDRLIIDDPHSIKTAESDAERFKTIRLFREGAINRLNDQMRSAIVVVMQRLHTNDVSGTILSDGMNYVHLCLPMEFELERRCQTSIGFSDPRTEDGQILDPVRFPPEALKQLRTKEFFWATQYQQRPVPREGGMFKRVWFVGDEAGANSKIISSDDVPHGVTWWRHWDLAGTRHSAADTRGARTAGVLMGRGPNGRFYVRDCIIRAIDGGEVRNLVLKTAEADNETYGNVGISLPQDPAQAGKIQKQDYSAMLAGYNVRISLESTEGNKKIRAEPFAAQCENGNVYLVNGGWVDDFLEEVCLFPGGARKDVVDACSGAFGRLVKRGGGERIAAPRVNIGTPHGRSIPAGSAPHLGI